MNTENVWSAIVPRFDPQTGSDPARSTYRRLEAQGEILHVHQDEHVSRVLTRTLGAAQALVDATEQDEHGPVVSVQPAVLYRAGLGGDGQALQADLDEIRRQGEPHLLYPLGPGAAFHDVSLYRD